MPSYHYICDNCGHELLENLAISQFKKRVKCPQCKKKSLVYQYGCNVRVIGLNVGSLAEKNTKAMGRYGLEEKIRQENAKRGIDPAKQKEFNRLKKLGRMTPKQKEKYIMEGELPYSAR